MANCGKLTILPINLEFYFYTTNLKIPSKELKMKKILCLQTKIYNFTLFNNIYINYKFILIFSTFIIFLILFFFISGQF